MNKNDLIIYEFNKIDILDLSEEQQLQLANEIVSNVNIKQLEEQIHDCILNLTGVGGPNWLSDAVYLALDNQKRLELVHQLLYYLDIFKSDVKYLRRIKDKYIESEKVYSFLLYTKDLIRTILDYGSYSKEDYETQIKQLEEAKKRNILSYYSGNKVIEDKKTDNTKSKSLGD